MSKQHILPGPNCLFSFFPAAVCKLRGPDGRESSVFLQQLSRSLFGRNLLGIAMSISILCICGVKQCIRCWWRSPFSFESFESFESCLSRQLVPQIDQPWLWWVPFNHLSVGIVLGFPRNPQEPKPYIEDTWCEERNKTGSLFLSPALLWPGHMKQTQQEAFDAQQGCIEEILGRVRWNQCPLGPLGIPFTTYLTYWFCTEGYPSMIQRVKNGDLCIHLLYHILFWFLTSGNICKMWTIQLLTIQWMKQILTHMGSSKYRIPLIPMDSPHFPLVKWP